MDGNTISDNDAVVEWILKNIFVYEIWVETDSDSDTETDTF